MRSRVARNAGKSLALVLLATLAHAGAGCGYTLQNSENPLRESEGVDRIYIAPVINNSYKPGVENVVYNSLVKNIAAHRRVLLVKHAEDADATLQGTVLTARFDEAASTSANNLQPLNAGPSTVTITSAYNAILECNFTLLRKNPRLGQKGMIWNSNFSRAKPFPAANQLGVLGSTSALINDSEFDRALSDISENMMKDVHESMLAMF